MATFKLDTEDAVDFIWMSYRYCIGRHSYVVDHANTILRFIKNNRSKFTDSRLKNFARDIKMEIEMKAHFSDCTTGEALEKDSDLMTWYNLAEALEKL